MIKSTFWRAFALTATLILTGCSHSQPEQEGRPQAWLEPGTRVSHAAVKLASVVGTLIVWVGEAGVRSISVGNAVGRIAPHFCLKVKGIK